MLANLPSARTLQRDIQRQPQKANNLPRVPDNNDFAFLIPQEYSITATGLGENGTKSEEQVAKDTIIKKHQLVVGDLKSELVNAQGLAEDVKKKFDKKLEVFMKEQGRS